MAVSLRNFAACSLLVLTLFVVVVGVSRPVMAKDEIQQSSVGDTMQLQSLNNSTMANRSNEEAEVRNEHAAVQDPEMVASMVDM
ncbi:hypothetical protein CsSME_00041579 [Camellia sinensis var. sinensis]